MLLIVKQYDMRGWVFQATRCHCCCFQYKLKAQWNTAKRNAVRMHSHMHLHTPSPPPHTHTHIHVHFKDNLHNKIRPKSFNNMFLAHRFKDIFPWTSPLLTLPCDTRYLAQGKKT